MLLLRVFKYTWECIKFLVAVIKTHDGNLINQSNFASEQRVIINNFRSFIIVK